VHCIQFFCLNPPSKNIECCCEFLIKKFTVFAGFAHRGDEDVQGQPGGQLPVAVAPRARRLGHEGLPADQAALALERVQPAIPVDGAGPREDPLRHRVARQRRLQSHLQVAQRRHARADATLQKRPLHQGRQLQVQRIVIFAQTQRLNQEMRGGGGRSTSYIFI
jgi:hypothetical protein